MKRLLASILVFIPLLASAQVLTLDSCLSLARQNNATIRCARLDVDKAKQVKAQAFAKYFPQVTASFVAYHSLNHLLGVTADDINDKALHDAFQDLLDSYNESNPGYGNEVGIMRHGLAVSGTAVQPIFMGGRVINANRYAKMGVEAASLQAEITERDVLESVESSYYLILGLQQKAQTVESALALLDSLDKTVAVSLSAGLLPQADALRINLKRNEMLANKQRISSGIHLASQLLMAEMGMEAMSADLIIDTVFPPVDLSLPVASAISRPESRLLYLDVRSEYFKKRLTIGEMLPSVALGGSYSYGDLLLNGSAIQLLKSKDAVYKGNGLLFLTASIPVSSWWEKAPKLREHNVSIEQARIRRDDLSQKMKIEVEKLYSDMLDAQALLKSDSASLQMAQENYRIAALNYASGIITLTELLEAHTLLLQAQDAATDHRISFIASRRRYLDLTAQ